MKPGEFVSSCGGTIQAGTASPANAPSGGGHRRIPDANCLLARLLVGPGQTSDFNNLHESWETSNEVRTANGRRLAVFDPYFQGTLLSIDFDSPLSGFNGVHRQIDINNNLISNADGPTVWYSDPFGARPRFPAAFAK